MDMRVRMHSNAPPLEASVKWSEELWMKKLNSYARAMVA